jgi:predicted AAA+ superfamily ATPase
MLGVSTYKDILARPVMACALRLLDALCQRDDQAALSAYTDLFCALRSEGHTGLGSWLAEALRYDDSPYPRLVERGGSDPVLESAAERDIVTFTLLASVDCQVWLGQLTELLGQDYQWLVSGLPQWSAAVPFTFEELTALYRAEGCGDFARYRAFVWEDGHLIGVAEPDCPTADELLGYDWQRQEVLQNTQALLAGRYVNNVLLYGESGTGKSATVKHLLTLPGMGDLRIIEADKENLGGLPALIRSLRGRRQKFIIFIDDLAFDRDDPTYSVLKTILEGGMERRPDNVAIYATSNRRHLVRQTISERAGDEMDRNETIQEKTSLADRFGLRVLFQGLNKQEFLALVVMLADQRGISMDREELHRQAVMWERLHASQTPRTALQFILSLS